MIRVGVLGDGESGRAFERLGAETCTVVRGEPATLVEAVDAVVVASDLDVRFHHAALALEAGRDVLIEQPVPNARMLERIASLRPVRPVVAVSHPDLFNPLLDELRAYEPVAIELRRIVPGCRDVVREAMVHDVELLVGLARSPLVRVHASGRGDPDHCVATLAFESGLIGTLVAGAAGPEPVSQATLVARDALVSADLRRGTLDVTRPDGVRESSELTLGNPHVAQAAAFLEAVRTRGAMAMTLRRACACIEVVDGVRECLAVQAAATGAGGVAAR